MGAAARAPTGCCPRRGAGARRSDARVDAIADLLGIDALLARKPAQLSGGQQQRVAGGSRPGARADGVPARRAAVPTSDAKLRIQMRGELKALHRRTGRRFVYVTHDQAEAVAMVGHGGADAGRTDRPDRPAEGSSMPAPRAARWRGSFGDHPINLIDVDLAPGAPAGPLAGWRPAGPAAAGPVTVGIRPEHLRPAVDGPIRGRLEEVEYLGAAAMLHVRLADAVRLGGDRPPGGGGGGGDCPTCRRRGRRSPLTVEPRHVHLFDRASGRRIDGRLVPGGGMIRLDRSRREALVDLWLAGPATLAIIVLIVVPVAMVAVLSLTDYQLGARGFEWIGLENYRDLFASPTGRRAVVNTLIYVAVVIPFSMGAGPFWWRWGCTAWPGWAPRLSNVLRAVYFPAGWRRRWWRWPSRGRCCCTRRSGWSIPLLSRAGLPGQDWLSDRSLVLYTLAAIGVWQTVGYNMVLFLAGLAAIPPHLLRRGRGRRRDPRLGAVLDGDLADAGADHAVRGGDHCHHVVPGVRDGGDADPRRPGLRLRHAGLCAVPGGLRLLQGRLRQRDNGSSSSPSPLVLTLAQFRLLERRVHYR